MKSEINVNICVPQRERERERTLRSFTKFADLRERHKFTLSKFPYIIDYTRYINRYTAFQVLIKVLRLFVIAAIIMDKL